MPMSIQFHRCLSGISLAEFIVGTAILCWLIGLMEREMEDKQNVITIYITKKSTSNHITTPVVEITRKRIVFKKFWFYVIGFYVFEEVDFISKNYIRIWRSFDSTLKNYKS